MYSQPRSLNDQMIEETNRLWCE